MATRPAGCPVQFRGRVCTGRRGFCDGSGSTSGVLRSTSSSSAWRRDRSAGLRLVRGDRTVTYLQLVHAWRVRLMIPAGAGCPGRSWESVPTDAIGCRCSDSGRDPCDGTRLGRGGRESMITDDSRGSEADTLVLETPCGGADDPVNQPINGRSGGARPSRGPETGPMIDPPPHGVSSVTRSAAHPFFM